MKKKIKDFKFLKSDDRLFPRVLSVIDWIQAGVVEVQEVKVMKKKWQKEFKEKYIGVLWGVPGNRVVVFSDRDIV